jgi:hypothetical protein
MCTFSRLQNLSLLSNFYSNLIEKIALNKKRIYENPASQVPNRLPPGRRATDSQCSPPVPTSAFPRTQQQDQLIPSYLFMHAEQQSSTPFPFMHNPSPCPPSTLEYYSFLVIRFQTNQYFLVLFFLMHLVGIVGTL